MKLRRVLAVVLSWLLLSLQSEVLVHPIAHLAKESRLQGATLTSTHFDESCVECPLLLGGLTAVPATLPLAVLGSAPARVAFPSYRSRAAAVPAWFQSRAPPTLL